MIAVIQRVKEAKLVIDKTKFSAIKIGLVVLLGIAEDDEEQDILWLSKKIITMRIFGDEENKMNKSLVDIEGELLLVSQFTLHANTKKGNRPSFIRAAKPEKAYQLYDKMIKSLESLLNKPIATGQFAAYMQVSLINDGPVTIIVDSKNKI